MRTATEVYLLLWRRGRWRLAIESGGFPEGALWHYMLWAIVAIANNGNFTVNIWSLEKESAHACFICWALTLRWWAEHFCSASKWLERLASLLMPWGACWRYIRDEEQSAGVWERKGNLNRNLYVSLEQITILTCMAEGEAHMREMISILECVIEQGKQNNEESTLPQGERKSAERHFWEKV